MLARDDVSIAPLLFNLDSCVENAVFARFADSINILDNIVTKT